MNGRSLPSRACCQLVYISWPLIHVMMTITHANSTTAGQISTTYPVSTPGYSSLSQYFDRVPLQALYVHVPSPRDVGTMALKLPSLSLHPSSSLHKSCTCSPSQALLLNNPMSKVFSPIDPHCTVNASPTTTVPGLSTIS